MSTPPTFGEHEFRKAQISEPNRDCVQVARRDGWVEIRDDKTTFGAPDDHRIRLTETQFDNYQAAVTTQKTAGQALELTPLPNNMQALRSTHTPAELVFTDREITAFHHGIRHGDFTPDAKT
jgi:hypothetical protein